MVTLFIIHGIADFPKGLNLQSIWLILIWIENCSLFNRLRYVLWSLDHLHVQNAQNMETPWELISNRPQFYRFTSAVTLTAST